MTFKVHFVTLAAAVALGQPLFGIQCVWAGEITTTEVVSLLRDAKIVSAANRLTAAISGKEVTVMTRRGAKLTDDDCKINAVLMAKTIMASYPIINRVKLMYAVEGSDSCDQVVVRTGDVKSFDSGAVTEEQLLSSLELQRVSGDQLGGASSGSSPVAAGPYRERRLMLLSRIEELKNAGTGVGPFLSSFNKIEDMIKASNVKDAPEALDTLARNLTEQEKLRRQAQKVSAGQGVRGASLQRPNNAASPINAVGQASSGIAKPGQPPIPRGAAGLSDAALAPDSTQPLSQHDKNCLLLGVDETRRHLDFLQNRGVGVGDFRNRLKDVETSVNKNSCTAVQELSQLQAMIQQRCNQSGGPGGYIK